MKYWKKILLVDWESIRLKLEQYLDRTKFQQPQRFWNPLNLEALQSEVPELNGALEEALGTRMLAATQLYMQPYSRTTLHVDHTEKQFGHLARLNLPISGHEGSSTVFYEVHSEPWQAPKGSSMLPTVWRWEDPYTIIDRVTVDEPTILRVTTPHAVLCSKPHHRVSITVNLDGDAAKFLND